MIHWPTSIRSIVDSAFERALKDMEDDSSKIKNDIRTMEGKLNSNLWRWLGLCPQIWFAVEQCASKLKRQFKEYNSMSKELLEQKQILAIQKKTMRKVKALSHKEKEDLIGKKEINRFFNDSLLFLNTNELIKFIENNPSLGQKTASLNELIKALEENEDFHLRHLAQELRIAQEVAIRNISIDICDQHRSSFC